MTKRPSVRAAAVQITPVFESREGTLQKVCASVAEAAARGAELVVFPETFLPYYPYFSFIRPPVQSGPEHLKLYEWALEVPGPECTRLSDAARKHGVCLVVGINEPHPESVEVVEKFL